MASVASRFARMFSSTGGPKPDNWFRLDGQDAKNQNCQCSQARLSIREWTCRCSFDISELGDLRDRRCWPKALTIATELTFGMGKRYIERDAALTLLEQTVPVPWREEKCQRPIAELDPATNVLLAAQYEAFNQSQYQAAAARVNRRRLEQGHQSESDQKEDTLLDAMLLLLGYLYATRCNWSFECKDMNRAMECWESSQDPRCAHYLAVAFKESAKHQQMMEWREKAIVNLTILSTREDEPRDAWGMFMLAKCYFDGDGVPCSPEVAVALYSQASKLGHSVAQNNLAVCFEKGFGIDANIEQAVALYTQSALQGDPGALNNLGVCHECGEGVEQDRAIAACLYELGALRGDPKAVANLALCYKQGQGVVKDVNRAIELYTQR
eukprot:gb/GEZN01007909.1/.p1 GENE.gb/GEZN01007909.1/~~gb/GEZN01007909.1/.p1  ORF type:complete len:383 (-),score=43.96 gb/GEZN01007909.1/:292-1440(-)